MWIMRNQKGNSTLFFCLLISLLFIMSMIIIKKKIKFIENSKKKLEFSLCVKKNNGELRKYNSSIAITNSLLKTLTIGEYTTLVLPPFIGVPLSKGVKQVIKAVKFSQVGFHISFMNHLRKLVTKGCIPSPNLVRTPFKFSLSGFERDGYNQAVKRRAEWNFRITNGTFYSISTLNVDSGKTKTQIKKALPF